MAKRRSNDSLIGEILKEFIEEHKLQNGIDKVAVRESWRSLMGNGVNAYTKEIELKGNILYVALTSSVLREELSLGKQKIVTMINDELQKEVIKDIVFR